MCAGRSVFACLRVCVRATAQPVLYMYGLYGVHARVRVKMCRGGGEVTVVCSAQHFPVLLLACYSSIMNEVLPNDRYAPI